MQEFLITVAYIIARLLTSRIFWIFAASIGSLILVVAWYRRAKLNALAYLEYTREFSSDGVFAKDFFTFTETVHNPTLLPLLSVKMEFFMPAGFTVDEVECRKYTKIASIFFIPPHASVKKSHSVRADLRGFYKFETATVLYRKNEFVFSAPYELHVYPSLSELNTEVLPDLFCIGESISKRKYVEDPFFLSGIRPYHAGDPQRYINYKASVRSFSGGSRQLMSNSYDNSRNYDSMLLLDLYTFCGDDSAEKQRNLLELQLSAACYLVSSIIKQGGNVGFAHNASNGSEAYAHISFGTGVEHAKKILESLARINYFDRKGYSLDYMIDRVINDAPVGIDIYILTPYVDEHTAASVRRLEGMGRNVCVIPISEGGLDDEEAV